MTGHAVTTRKRSDGWLRHYAFCTDCGWRTKPLRGGRDAAEAAAEGHYLDTRDVAEHRITGQAAAS